MKKRSFIFLNEERKLVKSKFEVNKFLVRLDLTALRLEFDNHRWCSMAKIAMAAMTATWLQNFFERCADSSVKAA